MGIKNLKHLLNSFCNDSINNKNLLEYSGKILAIDCSIYLYKYIYNNSDILDGFTRQTLRLMKNGILPLYVFDGSPPKEKSEVLKNRKDKKILLYTKKEKIEEKILKVKNIINNKYEFNDDIILDIFEKDFNKLIEENINIDLNIENNKKILFENKLEKLREELNKVNKKIVTVNDIDIVNLKKLFDLFGVPYIIANGEAEALCSKLCQMNIIYGCISEDTDILANGGLIFIRNFNPDKNIVEEYSLKSILSKLEITYNQFIDICIMCGCDYTNKIIGIGPITSLKLIKKYNDLENLINIIKDNKKITIPENFDYKTARNIFLNGSIENDINEIKKKIYINQPQIDELIKLLDSKSDKIKIKYIKEISKNLNKYYNIIINNIKS